MSRTYRRNRRKSPIAESWNSYSESVREWYRQRYIGKTDEEILHLQDVEYHCDNHPGEWSPTSAFNKGLHIRTKNKNRLDLIRCLRTGDEFVETPFKRDSGFQFF